MRDTYMDRANTETCIIREPFATGASMGLKKHELHKRSVYLIVKEISLPSLPPGYKSGMELYRLVHCISTTSSRAAPQITLRVPAETDILKNGLLLSPHLTEVSARYRAKLEVFKRSETMGITQSSFHPIVKSYINHAHKSTSQAPRLPQGTICSSKSVPTEEPIEKE